MASIGSRENNVAFLDYLTLTSDLAMIASGCVLCRDIGHAFTVACHV